MIVSRSQEKARLTQKSIISKPAALAALSAMDVSFAYQGGCKLPVAIALRAAARCYIALALDALCCAFKSRDGLGDYISTTDSHRQRCCTYAPRGVPNFGPRDSNGNTFSGYQLSIFLLALHL
ncbi:hypothetical protein NDU88_006470 [Pleurodeles waltl]|uniref:Uncharacterized protein n=1 Tax=Pleurodeles waltl TaxID=8319 RepID=A0AAV7WDM8_PLEWA|nr:hypothetical protein NDU88_006470 [Pleurodeles waltl]